MRPNRRRLAVLLCASLAALGAACGSGASKSAMTTGIRGEVLAGPQCPVEQVGATTACAPRPIAAIVRVVDAESGGAVGRVRTDGRGRFRIALPPGRYRIQASAGPS